MGRDEGSEEEIIIIQEREMSKIQSYKQEISMNGKEILFYAAREVNA